MFSLILMLFLQRKAIRAELMGLYNLLLHTAPCPKEIERLNSQIVFLESILIWL